MKKQLTIATLFALVAFQPMAALGDDKAKESKPKPYPLQTCIVTDEKLGDHGKPYIFTHEGQEVKLCCKGCLKDFKREPAKYTKKIEKPRR